MQFKRLLTLMMAAGVLIVQIPARASEVPQISQAVEDGRAAQNEIEEESPTASAEETSEEAEEEVSEETEEETSEEVEEEALEEAEEEALEETEEETSEEAEEETSEEAEEEALEETEEETPEEIAEETPEEEVSEETPQGADADTEDSEDEDEESEDPDAEEDDWEDEDPDAEEDSDAEEDDGEDEDSDEEEDDGEDEDSDEEDEDSEYDPDAASPIGDADEDILYVYSHDEGGCEEDDYNPPQDAAFDYDKNGDGKIEKSESVSFANIFTALRDEWLTAIGTYVKSAGSEVEFWIYLLNDNYESPEDGTLVYDVAGEDAFIADEAGYQEFDLETPVTILKGQVFSIVGRIFGDNGGQLPIETATMESGKTFDVERGQSFYKDENGNWIDICDLRVDPDQYEGEGICRVGNVILRAVTVPAGDKDNDDLIYSGADGVSNKDASFDDNSDDQTRTTDSDSPESEETESDGTATKGVSAKTADQSGAGKWTIAMLSGLIGLTAVLGKKRQSCHAGNRRN